MLIKVEKLANNKFTYTVTFDKGTRYRRNTLFDSFEDAEQKAKNLEVQMKVAQDKFGSAMVFPFRDRSGNALFVSDADFGSI